MKNKIPDALLSQLSEFIAAGTALQFSREHWNDLDRRAGYAAEEFGFTDKEAFVQWLVSSSLNREHIEILASHLTVSETYFWRESRIFDALEEQILPELIRSREKGVRQIRIWCAGCATGEEPYSIAIALSRAISSLADWRITIMATDINTNVLRKAMAGVYGKWSFRNAPIWLEKNYFRRQEDGKYELIPEIRKMVIFEYLNLTEDVYPSHLNNTNAMDLIFCRNVLMYFAPERTSQIVNKLYRSLIDGGWLMVGASELSGQIFPQFTAVHFTGATAYRKLYQVSLPQAVFHFEETFPRQASDQLPLGKPHEVDPVSFSQGCNPVKENILFRVIESTEDTPVSSLDVTEKPEDSGTKPAISVSVRSLADQGKLVEALALCETAIASDKLDPEMHYLHAIILQEKNSEAEAIASLKRALYLKSDFIPANFVLGNLLMRRGNKQAGKRYLQNVLAILGSRQHEDILPESDGMTAGRLKEIIEATMRLKELKIEE